MGAVTQWAASAEALPGVGDAALYLAERAERDRVAFAYVAGRRRVMGPA